ncbi:MAG: lipoate--protein ligase family protein [Candidatus Omnitrophota bacterium]
MVFVNYYTDSPEENVALDELLLIKAENGFMEGSLRFWESSEYFVVAGRASVIEEDCFSLICRGDGVKIIRRVSGGGTVLQGPGCLNFSLILPYPDGLKYTDIKGSYEWILKRLSGALSVPGRSIEVLPVSDLVIGGRKISGNAQARKRGFFLHHGTFLTGFDLSKISRYLKHPPKEPAYRQKREHADFLADIPVEKKEIKETVKKLFLGDTVREWAPEREDLDGLAYLVEKKYSRAEWNYMF